MPESPGSEAKRYIATGAHRPAAARTSTGSFDIISGDIATARPAIAVEPKPPRVATAEELEDLFALPAATAEASGSHAVAKPISAPQVAATANATSPQSTTATTPTPSPAPATANAAATKSADKPGATAAAVSALSNASAAASAPSGDAGKATGTAKADTSAKPAPTPAAKTEPKAAAKASAGKDAFPPPPAFLSAPKPNFAESVAPKKESKPAPRPVPTAMPSPLGIANSSGAQKAAPTLMPRPRAATPHQTGGHDGSSADHASASGLPSSLPPPPRINESGATPSSVASAFASKQGSKLDAADESASPQSPSGSAGDAADGPPLFPAQAYAEGAHAASAAPEEITPIDTAELVASLAQDFGVADSTSTGATLEPVEHKRHAVAGTASLAAGSALDPKFDSRPAAVGIPGLSAGTAGADSHEDSTPAAIVLPAWAVYGGIGAIVTLSAIVLLLMIRPWAGAESGDALASKDGPPSAGSDALHAAPSSGVADSAAPAPAIAPPSPDLTAANGQAAGDPAADGTGTGDTAPELLALADDQQPTQDELGAADQGEAGVVAVEDSPPPADTPPPAKSPGSSTPKKKSGKKTEPATTSTPEPTPPKSESSSTPAKSEPKSSSPSTPSAALATAKQALAAKNYSKALSSAQEAMKGGAGSDAAEIAAQAACSLKNESAAKNAFKQVRLVKRPGIKAKCKDNGIKL